MTKSKQKFTLPPTLSEEEKAKKAEEFINLSEKIAISETVEKTKKSMPTQKESVKAIYIRAPESLWQDARNIVNITGLTMNAVCLELLRPAIKKKLKELQADED